MQRFRVFWGDTTVSVLPFWASTEPVVSPVLVVLGVDLLAQVCYNRVEPGKGVSPSGTNRIARRVSGEGPVKAVRGKATMFQREKRGFTFGGLFAFQEKKMMTHDVRITFRAPARFERQLQQEARRRGVGVSELIRSTVADAIGVNVAPGYKVRANGKKDADNGRS